MQFFVSRKKIQSMVEGETQSILNLSLQDILKTLYSKYTNQYITYAQQVKAIYDGYQAKSAFGASYVADIIDKRVNLIISEGLSITAKKKATQDFINTFIDDNNLDGSRLIEIGNISEMEGRCLSYISPDVKKDGKKYVKVKNYRHYLKNYTVKGIDDEPDSVEMKEDGKEKSTVFKKEDFVYMHNGIALDQNPNPCIASVLTECEFADRTLYDLRFNNHLYGVATPNIKTTDAQMADKVRNDIDKNKWKPGRSIVGPEISFPQPPNAGDNVGKELSFYIKKISSRTSIPVHWIGWTDLMSNRACYSEDTETLTENGFKYFWEIGKDEKIACFNPENNSIEYHLPSELYVYYYKGIMHHYKTQRVDCLVTPDHKMWISEKTKQDKSFKKIKSEEIQSYTFDFQNAGDYYGEKILKNIIVEKHDSFYKNRDKQPINFEANDFLEFLGWYLSEGGTGRYKTTPKNKNKYHYLIHISNKNEIFVKMISDCLNRMGLKYNETIDKDNCHRWHIHHSGLAKYLEENFGDKHYNKRIPYFIREINKEQLQILFKSLILGDGFFDKRRPGSAQYGTTSKNLSDNLSDIAIKLGYAVSQSTTKKIGMRKEYYRLSMSKAIYQEVRKNFLNKINYNGNVYCFTTPTGLFFTRRNGKITIQGNTAMELRDFISNGIRDDKIRFREFIREIILKAMVIAVDSGIDGAVYDEDFVVDIPDVSTETVKALNETWLPLYDAKLISKFDVQNKIPGINPMKTNKEIEREEKDNMEKFSAGLLQPEHDEENPDEEKEEVNGKTTK